MEAFIGSGVLAALAGLAWLAYEHPEEFRKLSWAAAIVFFLTTMGVLLWNIAVTETAVLAIHAAPRDHEAVADAIEAAKVKSDYLILLGIGFPFYMAFLELFVGKLKRGSKRRLKDEENEE